jgi:MYXO-CTERM domain-containing protein
MPWGTFVVYNALGGISWATSVGLLSYWAGPSADTVLKTVGIGGLAVALVALVVFLVWRRRRAPR